MAIVVETLVPRATRDHAGEFDASSEVAMMLMGGPPPGLMVHFARPAGEGFLLRDVWRSETEMRPFYDDVILPKLPDAGLVPEESHLAPVWSSRDRRQHQGAVPEHLARRSTWPASMGLLASSAPKGRIVGARTVTTSGGAR